MGLNKYERELYDWIRSHPDATPKMVELMIVDSFVKQGKMKWIKGVAYVTPEPTQEKKV